MPEYWIVDVNARVVHVLHVFDEIVQGRYGRSRPFDATATLAPKAFPDASLSVGELFAP